MLPINTPIRIVIADECAVFREGFETLLTNQGDIHIVGHASNGTELIQLVKKRNPNLVITGIQMQEVDGIEASRTLMRLFPELGIIAVSYRNEEAIVTQMLELGVKGYLLKSATKTEMVEAVKSVYRRDVYYCRATSKLLSRLAVKHYYSPQSKKPLLTPKEHLIIKLICEEFSNKEIAEKLKLTCRSIESSRERILEKIGAKNMAGVIIYAIKNKIYLILKIYLFVFLD
jgi:DNA-binding NarL/FixJ family response regulator